MVELTTDLSQRQAVTALRVLYPIWALIGMFSLFYVPSKLIVAGDAVLTASNIVANSLLFRMGVAGSLITQLIHIAVVLVLYQLFKSVNKNQSLLVMIFGLVGIPIAMLNELNNFAALSLLNNAEQMMFFLNLNGMGIYIAQIFWGLWLLPLGYLIYKSGYFPRIIGSLVSIAGFGFLLGSFMYFLIPEYTVLISISEFLTIGEIIFMLWVLLKGANIPSNDKDSKGTKREMSL